MNYQLLDTEYYFDQAEAVYTFCVLNHEGMSSNKYSILSSRLNFEPGCGWSESDVEENNEFYGEVETWDDDKLELFVEELEHYFENITISSSDELCSKMELIHRNPDDLIKGDLLERINSVDYYSLESLDINLLDLNEWDVDEDLVEDYVSMNETNMPPVIVHKYLDQYSIVDGIHRLNALSQKGYKSIKAYVGNRDDDD